MWSELGYYLPPGLDSCDWRVPSSSRRHNLPNWLAARRSLLCFSRCDVRAQEHFVWIYSARVRSLPSWLYANKRVIKLPRPSDSQDVPGRLENYHQAYDDSRARLRSRFNCQLP